MPNTPPTRHILGAYEDAITRLNGQLLRMASLAEQNLANALRGLLERDENLCNRAIADDSDTDELEKAIDQLGHEMIVRYSPVGRDLRRIISSMKVCTALERVSDHAVSLARRARELNQRPPLDEVALLKPVYELAAGQLKQSVDAFLRGDLALALHIVQNDDPLDIAHYELIDRLTARIGVDNARARDYVPLLFCTRMLERIGDQAVNIAEDAIYQLTAQDVRHGGDLPPAPAE